MGFFDSVTNFASDAAGAARNAAGEAAGAVKSAAGAAYNAANNAINKITGNPDLGEKAKDEEAPDRIRLGEQVALMLHVDDLIKNVAKGEPNIEATVIEKDETQREHFVTKQLPPQPRISKQYKNYATYRGESGTVSLMYNLTRNEYIQYLFSEISNDILSSLVPSIELYKVFYPYKSTDASGYSWRVPFDDVATKYKGETSPYVTNSLFDVLSGDGRLNGVGIKSFRYKFHGTNPADVNTNIEAELELYFQDIRDLVKRFNFDRGNGNFVKHPPINALDAGEEDKKGFGYSFSYADLAVDSPMFREQKSSPSKIYNNKYFRLKAIIGYSNNESTIDKLVDDPERAEKIKKALRSAKVILNLNPYSHDIQFDDSGAVTLKIQYIASMTTAMNSINVLDINDKFSEIEILQGVLDSYLYDKKQEIDEIMTDCSINEEQRKKRSDEKAQEITKKIEKKKAELETQKNLLYSEIFKRFVNVQQSNSATEQEWEKTPAPKMYSAIFNAYAVGAEPSVGDDAPLEEPNKVRLENLQKARDFNIESYQVDSMTKTDVEEFGLAVNMTRNLAQTAGDKYAEQLKKISYPENTPRTDFKDVGASEYLMMDTEYKKNHYRVKFVFLGDIIDIFCDPIRKLDPHERPRVILTNFKIQIPKTPTGKYNDFIYEDVILNVADIPVSLTMLHNFIVEKIVKPRRTNYTLTELLNDLMTDIVSPAVSPSVFGRNATFNKNVRLSSLNVSVPFESHGNSEIDTITGRDSIFNFNGEINEEELKKLNIYDRSLENMYKEESGNYFIIYCSNAIPDKIANAKGDYDEDHAAGIYHFFIGSDRGMIKKMNFSKVDIPFMKEASFQSSTGDKTMARIREVYDTSINMLGNNIFKPGDFIYIEPLFFSGKAAVDLQNKIGIGGYYQVLDVTTTINENIYETAIRSALVAHIDDKGKVIPAEQWSKC